jgi:uncharacterized protein (UPF0261 family)
MVVNWGPGSYRVTCSDSRATDSFILNVLSDTPEDAASAIAVMSNSVDQLVVEMTNVAAIVSGLGGLNTADIINGLNDLDTALASVKSDVAAIESPDVAAIEGGLSEIKTAVNALDLSTLNSIESQLTTLASKEDGTQTLVGKIESVASQLNEISGSSSQAASSAQSAKTAATAAAAGIEDLKDALAAGEVDDSMDALRQVRKSLIEAQESINNISEMMTSGMAGSLADMMKMLKDMADEEGFSGLVKTGEATTIETGDKSVEALNRNIQEMKGKMHHMQKLLDESAYKPVVTEILIGER